MAKSLEEKMEGLLAPHQLGVSVRGGAEVIVHTIKEVIEKEPDKWVLQLDLANAFNRVDRSCMLAEVARLLPECLPWAVTCYGSPSFLQFGTHTISSSTGVQQGDPLAAILFALVLHPVILAITAEVPSLAAHSWFHDDGNAAGTVQELQKVVQVVRREGPARGLHLNDDKSSVWCPQVIGPGQADPLQCGIKRVEESGIKLLGCPVGSRDFIQNFLLKKVDKVRSITTELFGLHHPHLEFVLLRSCLALPKMIFLLRSTNTSSFHHILQEFDDITRNALSRILGGPVSNLGWDQAKTPVCMGGLGLRAALDHADAAYATSFMASETYRHKLQHLEENETTSTLAPNLLTSLSGKMGEEDVLTSEYFAGVSQREVCVKIDLNNKHLLSERVNQEGCVRDIARLASVGIKDSHAGDWLTVVPSPGLGLRLHPSEFVVALRHRLGHPIFTSDGPCPACGQASDRMGVHAMNCAWQGERIARHNALRDTLHSSAAAAALAPAKEGRFLLPGEGGRPADVLIPSWSSGKDVAYDVTVINPLQESEVRGAAATPGHSLSVAHKRKLDKSWEACHNQGIVFVPLAVESLGAWHPTAIAEVKKLGSALARHNGEEESTTTSRLFQRLSICLMRGNAALFNNRSPPDQQVLGDELVW